MSKEKNTNTEKKEINKTDLKKQVYLDKISEETQKKIAKIRATIYNERRK